MKNLNKALMLCSVIVFTFGCVIKKPIETSWKDEYAKWLVDHKQSLWDGDRVPLEKDQMKDVSFFPANETWNVLGSFEPLFGEKILVMPTSSGKSKQFEPHGKFRFTKNGKRSTLTIYRSLATTKMPGYEDYLFLPFRDLTSGDETYGGGRYIDLRLHDISKDQKSVRVDFNKAYNPYCAYGDGWNCPLPPEDNTLKIAVEAGAKAFSK